MDSNGVTHVVVACPDEASRSHIAEAVKDDRRISVLATVADPREALEVAKGRRSRPVIVMGLGGLSNPSSSVATCAAAFPVVAIAANDADPVISDVLRSGAAACLVWDSITGPQIVEAAAKAAVGDSYLSPGIITRLFEEFRRTPTKIEGPGGELTEREREIMGLVAQGLRNRQIAAALFLSEKTVKNHINHVYGKLVVKDRAEAIDRWEQMSPN